MTPVASVYPSVGGVVIACPKAAPARRGQRLAQLAAGCVSGRRSADQASDDQREGEEKAEDQVPAPTSITPPPMVGATIGTTMKTIITKDITSAIRRPP